MDKLNQMKNVSQKLGINRLITESHNDDYYGYYQRFFKLICIVEFNEDEKRTMAYNNKYHTYKKTHVQTFAHECTHHLQHEDGRYNGMRELGYITSNEDDKHRNGIYAYNEIVANTVAMLLYPSQDMIIDNINYSNMYIKEVSTTSKLKNKEVFNYRLNNDLMDDCDRYYNILKPLFEAEGLL